MGIHWRIVPLAILLMLWPKFDLSMGALQMSWSSRHPHMPSACIWEYGFLPFQLKWNTPFINWVTVAQHSPYPAVNPALIFT